MTKEDYNTLKEMLNTIDKLEDIYDDKELTQYFDEAYNAVSKLGRKIRLQEYHKAFNGKD